MSKFEKHDDLFSFNRCLMEDDYNDGQTLVVKDKRKMPGGFENTNTVKVGDAKDGQHKVALETKFKGHLFTNDTTVEAKFKNSGLHSSEYTHELVSLIPN